jgi:tripartite-type tricarboxylate transporter receptor subunit TctC
MKRRAFLGAAWCALWAPAFGQGRYPERPIRLLVPFVPGGETDLMGRLWAKYAAPHLGATIVVENKAGAGGSIGAVEVARSRPDGYSLLAGTTSTQILNPAAMNEPPYDPVKDFVTAGLVSTTPTCVVVNPGLQISSLKELASLVKAHPGKYSYGSAGPGTITNLTGELLKLQGGLDMQHIPYKGSAPGIQDLIAGHLPIFTPILSTSLISHHRGGRLRILAINSEARVKSAPEIPTAIEAGMPGMRVQVFNGVFAPAGTPQPVIELLRQATAKAKAEAGLQQDLQNAGAELWAPGDLDGFIGEEVARWTPIIKATGFRIQ